MTTNEPPGDLTCPQCGGDVPALAYCVRCGYSLDDDPMPARRSGRTQFAAAPRERAWAPHVVSTLFPQLPDADMTYFGIALVLGLATIVGLALGGLYPIALTVAAALTPLLVFLYLVAVDVYEDEPPLVLGLTMVWGAVVGLVLGLLLQNVDAPLRLLRSTCSPTATSSSASSSSRSRVRRSRSPRCSCCCATHASTTSSTAPPSAPPPL